MKLLQEGFLLIFPMNIFACFSPLCWQLSLFMSSKFIILLEKLSIKSSCSTEVLVGDTMSVPDLDWSPILCVVSFRCSITNFQNVFIVRTEGEFWKKNLIFLIQCWERCRGDKDKRTLKVGPKDLNAHYKEFTFERSQTNFSRKYDKKLLFIMRSLLTCCSFLCLMSDLILRVLLHPLADQEM